VATPMANFQGDVFVAGDLIVTGHRSTDRKFAFIRSNDISVFIVPKMAHMHNFAGTRELLWQRVCHWSQMIARRKRLG
jgi:hypothetical protein